MVCPADESLVEYLRTRVADLQRTIFEQQNRIDELEFQIRSARFSDAKITSMGVDAATETHEAQEENDIGDISTVATMNADFSATAEAEFDEQRSASTKCESPEESPELSDAVEQKEHYEGRPLFDVVLNSSQLQS